jgi:hypothetical protein
MYIRVARFAIGEHAPMGAVDDRLATVRGQGAQLMRQWTNLFALGSKPKHGDSREGSVGRDRH